MKSPKWRTGCAVGPTSLAGESIPPIHRLRLLALSAASGALALTPSRFAVNDLQLPTQATMSVCACACVSLSPRLAVLRPLLTACLAGLAD
ncbi:hypothetical protein BO99DRAFT_400144 [Aspergillus violaceofuscus CBS 115571]|uniref:Uncharacterized protein n=1 Tax=Aspergillus violaceofuscus (strain CBS 115571) TaxID=1450538 RepID=A0A2V5HDC1_ASPV1|nr:hypothetical protein BO99DRAFT_400144 [Aspergillus violaceofuscus CBS 115571]